MGTPRHAKLRKSGSNASQPSSRAVGVYLLASAFAAGALGCDSNAPTRPDTAGSESGDDTTAVATPPTTDARPAPAKDSGAEGTSDEGAPLPAPESSGGSRDAGASQEPSSLSDDATPMELCRHYFESICERITSCEAPRFRPCESPADLCPDILFGAGSTWSAEDVLSCVESWRTHSCEDLKLDRWPECSFRPGTRALGDACVFDAQCQSATCGGGIVPAYQLACGTCVTPAQPGEACDATRPCSYGAQCSADVCVELTAEPGPTPTPASECDASTPCLPGRECVDGTCHDVDLGPLPRGAACSIFTQCESGLDCEVELFEEQELEPDVGTCQPLPVLGEPCLPTFRRSGVCAEGATCDSRPSGDCIALRQIGEYCGYASCVDEAFCQVLGLDDSILPSHTCYPRRAQAELCYGHDSICADGLHCGCAEPNCEQMSMVCIPRRLEGETCDDVDQVCAQDLSCVGTICAVPPPAWGELGEPCSRGVRFGRVSGSCTSTVAGLECLCSTPQCSASYCAFPSSEGESCNETTALCRQGQRCENGSCTSLETQDIEAAACP